MSAFEILFTSTKKYDALQYISFIYQGGPQLFVQTVQQNCKREQQTEPVKKTHTLEITFQQPHNLQPNLVSHSTSNILYNTIQNY